jgi:hypothetical protein
LIALPILTACGGGDSGSSSTMNLSIADGPIDSANHVVIELTGVELQPSGGGKTITFNFGSPKQLDLLTLQNGDAAHS